MPNNTHTIIIRRLQDKDYDQWLRLRQALWPEASLEKQQGEMAELLAQRDAMPVFVAQQADGKLCGMVEVAIRRKASGCTTDKIGYLEGWYVDSAWREQGIGSQLVEAAETWARHQGCSEMASDTCTGYPISPTAHARLGYVEVHRDIFFRKVLAPVQ